MSTKIKSGIRVVSGQAAPNPAVDLEPLICDLHRAAHITFLMCMRDGEEGTDDPLGSLGLFMAELTERLSKELRDAYLGADA